MHFKCDEQVKYISDSFGLTKGKRYMVLSSYYGGCYGSEQYISVIDDNGSEQSVSAGGFKRPEDAIEDLVSSVGDMANENERLIKENERLSAKNKQLIGMGIELGEVFERIQHENEGLVELLESECNIKKRMMSEIDRLRAELAMKSDLLNGEVN